MKSIENHLSANRDQVISETDDFTAERYGQMLRFLPAGALRVLDVGCGIGRGGAAMKALRPEMELVGLDCVPERIAKLDASVYAKGLTAFSHDLEFDDRSVDAIVAGEFLEHVRANLVYPTLSEFFRILKLGGIFVMTTPNPYYLRNLLKGLSVLTDPAHTTQFYPKILRHRLMEVGFSRIRMKGSGKVSRFLGQEFPLFFYGSYLVAARKW